MKKVAIIQSNYIPWKGYFDIIHDVDLFIFYDDVQFTKNDWRNRNKIKTVNGLVWLTLPVGKKLDRLICEVRLADDGWRKKHWSTIQQAYSKAPYFTMYRDFFEHVYLGMQWSGLSELNQFVIRHISQEFLDIKTDFQDSREFHVQGQKLDRLIDLLQKAGASLYVSGPSAQAYIDDKAFQTAGIELVYKEYTGYPEYQQLYPPFEHAVSILDLLFNCGPSAAYFIWGWRGQ
jgi:hypothetical protein